MKEWEKHREEMVQLYAQHTLEVVMTIMRTRHNFNASRRSYMENFAKWSVHKYKRKGRQVVVHNSQTDGDNEEAKFDDDNAAAGEHAESSSSQAPSQSTQSLVLPYTSHSNHTPSSEASHGLPTDHQQQYQRGVAAPDWEYFHAWPVQQTPMQEYDPNSHVTQQYLAAAHQVEIGHQVSGPPHHVNHPSGTEEG